MQKDDLLAHFLHFYKYPNTFGKYIFSAKFYFLAHQARRGHGESRVSSHPSLQWSSHEEDNHEEPRRASMWSSHEGDNFLSSAPVTRLSVVRIVEVKFQEMFILGIQASMLLADAEGWHKARPVLRTLTKKTLSPIFNITILSMRLK